MIEVTCMCGFQARGTEDEVVEQIQTHGASDHGSVSSREQILAMATPAPADGAGG
jgi:predicted small metal-binding protein